MNLLHVALIDVLPVLGAVYSSYSGIRVVGGSFRHQEFSWAHIRRGHVPTLLFIYVALSTTAALWHLKLMLLWALKDGASIIGLRLEIEFMAWHTLASALMAASHMLAQWTYSNGARSHLEGMYLWPRRNP